MTRRSWSLRRGATVLTGRRVRFSVWAPLAERVAVTIIEADRATDHVLERSADGSFAAVIDDVAPGTDYSYRLDDQRGRPDPVSRHQPHGVHGPSRVVDPAGYAWSDQGWVGLEMADLIIYEIHVGTFTAQGTFDGAIPRLPYLRDLGVTAIELMPVAEFPGQRNWGYDGVHPYAPHSGYGGPGGLRRLVDAAHGEGLAVILDTVQNHLGPEGNYLAEFGPYFSDRYTTPWGHAVNFDGPGSAEVRRYFIDNALYWISEYHIDGLRLDAVQAIHDSSEPHILSQLAAAVHEHASQLGRRALVIAESDQNEPGLLRGPDAGGFGLDGAWNDDFHHAIHAALTGERNGYYADFGDVGQIASVMSDRYWLAGRNSVYHGGSHGAPATDVAADRFVVYVQNHDQVGNRERGERLTQLVSDEHARLAAALLLLSPYVPLLFMGEEYGEPSPFLYFVDHTDPALVQAVRAGRRREFARFDWHGPIPDPGDTRTFLASRVNTDHGQRAPHAQLAQLYRDLIRIRRSLPALRPAAGRCDVACNAAAGWLAIGYDHDAGQAVAAFNLSELAGNIEIQVREGAWRRWLATTDAAYGGPGSCPPLQLTVQPTEPIRILMPGYSAALYCREAS
ncbi:MAG TPA: malto-oligosyltrehalose trehalohydrolase [Gemmatimonadota bacterium]|nr:malto-oligosyltrehalose trehalohydrolase [Gemmatimonadota bacterium]